MQPAPRLLRLGRVHREPLSASRAHVTPAELDLQACLADKPPSACGSHPLSKGGKNQRPPPKPPFERGWPAGPGVCPRGRPAAQALPVLRVLAYAGGSRLGLPKQVCLLTRAVGCIKLCNQTSSCMFHAKVEFYKNKQNYGRGEC